MADVDVVIVAYGSADTLARAVESALAAPEVADVVVVDNESPDDSGAIARQVGARVVDAGANRGFGAGCNIGMAATTAPFVLLLNPDAVLEAGTVRGLRDALVDDARAAIVASEVVDERGRPEPVRRRFPSVWRTPLEPGLAGRLDERWYRRRGPADGAVEWLSASCALVRRTAFDAVGGFDERYFLYSEETDLCARLASTGWKMRWVPGCRTVHASGRSTAALPGAGKVAWVDGFLRFARLHHRHPVALRAALVAGLAGRTAAWRVAGRREAASRWRLALAAAMRR